MSNSTNVAPVVGRALLVSNDPPAAEQLANSMQKFAIFPETCTHAPTALGLISTRKYEAVVVDLALGQHAAGLLEGVRLSPANHNAVTFIVVGTPDQYSGPPLQPNFILRKPLDDAEVEVMLRVALGSIIRDYRRYFRCAVACPATVRIRDEAGLECEMINVSEGGFAVNTSTKFPVGAAVRAQFTLPGDAEGYDLEADVCWSDDKGRAGFQFQSVPSHQKARLQGWLSRKIEQGLPERVSRLFEIGK